jgi:hypothetical protein
MQGWLLLLLAEMCQFVRLLADCAHPKNGHFQSCSAKSVNRVPAPTRLATYKSSTFLIILPDLFFCYLSSKLLHAAQLHPLCPRQEKKPFIIWQPQELTEKIPLSLLQLALVEKIDLIFIIPFGQIHCTNISSHLSALWSPAENKPIKSCQTSFLYLLAKVSTFNSMSFKRLNENRYR